MGVLDPTYSSALSFTNEAVFPLLMRIPKRLPVIGCQVGKVVPQMTRLTHFSSEGWASISNVQNLPMGTPSNLS